MRGFLLIVSVAFTSFATPAVGQEWPAKQPVKVIVTNTPGSALDLVSRIVFEEVGRRVGQTFVVESRPGAANTIGITAVAKAEPDGYTILAVPSSIAIVPHTHKLSYDTERDLRPVIPLGNLTNVMVTAAGHYRSLKDLVAAAKAKPDALTYASIGPGSTGHMSAERLAMSAGFKALHVPFKGSPEAVREVAAGRVDFFFTPVGAALGLIREGKVDTIAVSSSTRSSLLPDVPTTVQAGFLNSEYDFWIGVFVPTGVPEPIVARLHSETKAVLEVPEIKERFAKLAVEPMPMSAAQFQAYLGKEIKTNEALVRAAGLSAK